MLALKQQILAICTDREKGLYQMVEKKMGGESEVVITLSGCTLKGVAGDIKFSDVARVAASNKEEIHPKYLRFFKEQYLRYLLKELYDREELDPAVAEEFGFNNRPGWDEHEFDMAEFLHRHRE